MYRYTLYELGGYSTSTGTPDPGACLLPGRNSEDRVTSCIIINSLVRYHKLS